MNDYRYGYSDIAAACGKTSGAVRVDVKRRKFDPESLVSVSMYVVVCRLAREGRDERAGK